MIVAPEPQAVDLGFDFVNFPSLDVNEQIRTIPVLFMKDIEFEEFTKARSHDCMVQKRASNHSGSWRCDKIKGAATCLSGITGFGQAKGIDCWRCGSCDWDLCIKCM